jgi:hypothetical protein
MTMEIHDKLGRELAHQARVEQGQTTLVVGLFDGAKSSSRIPLCAIHKAEKDHSGRDGG